MMHVNKFSSEINAQRTVRVMILIACWMGWSAQNVLAQQITEADFLKRMDHGEDLMKQGKHVEADVEFLFVIDNMKVLPSEIAFLFGQNSYHLGKYKQGINWLNKYIQIKGTKGRYYEPAVKYLQLSESKYIEIQREKNAEMSTELAGDDYDCDGLENMICPVCHGNGVIIKQTFFDKVYQTCPYSAGEPYLTCEEYNLFMRGILEPKVPQP